MAARPDYQFGYFAGGHDVDLILYQLIDKWLLTYLYEIARRSGEEYDELKPFRSWRVSTELEKMPEDQTPGLIIVNLGLADNPVKRGSGNPGQSFYATWNYQFGCLTSARGKKINASPRAIRLAQMYCTAVRLILIQKRDDEGILGMLDWMDENYDGLDSEDDRTICLAHTDFWVNVSEAATWANGPLEPIPEPTPDSPIWPTVVTADIEIDKIALEQPFPEPEPPKPPDPDDGTVDGGDDDVLLATIHGVEAWAHDRLATSTPQTKTITDASDINVNNDIHSEMVIIDRTEGGDNTVTVKNLNPNDNFQIYFFDSGGGYMTGSTPIAPGASYDVVIAEGPSAYGIAFFNSNNFLPGDFEVSVNPVAGLIRPPSP